MWISWVSSDNYVVWTNILSAFMSVTGRVHSMRLGKGPRHRKRGQLAAITFLPWTF